MQTFSNLDKVKWRSLRFSHVQFQALTISSSFTRQTHLNVTTEHSLSTFKTTSLPYPIKCIGWSSQWVVNLFIPCTFDTLNLFFFLYQGPWSNKHLLLSVMSTCLAYLTCLTYFNKKCCRKRLKLPSLLTERDDKPCYPSPSPSPALPPPSIITFLIMLLCLFLSSLLILHSQRNF